MSNYFNILIKSLIIGASFGSGILNFSAHHLLQTVENLYLMSYDSPPFWHFSIMPFDISSLPSPITSSLLSGVVIVLHYSNLPLPFLGIRYGDLYSNTFSIFHQYCIYIISINFKYYIFSYRI